MLVRLQTFTQSVSNLYHNFTVKFLASYWIKKSYKHEANWQHVLRKGTLRREGIRRGGYRKHIMLFIMLLCHCMFIISVQEGRIRPGCTVWPVLARRQKGEGAPSCWWYIEQRVWCGMSFLELLAVHLTKSINVAYQPLYASATQSAEGSCQAQSSNFKVPYLYKGYRSNTRR